MITYLIPLKRRFWLITSSLALFCGLVGITAWIFITDFLVSSDLFAIITVVVIIAGIAVLFGMMIANQMLIPVDFLARAVLLVSREDNQVEAPDPDSLNAAAKEFLAGLAKNVYELATTGSHVVRGNDSELPFYRSLINAIPLPVLVLDQSRQISFANEAALHYINLPASDVIAKFFYDCLDLSFVSDLTLEAWLDKSSQNAVVDNEVWQRVRLSLPEGKRQQFDLAAHYSNNDPNGVETILVFFDRTMEYERDDHDLTFVSLAVHELRTPLTIMRGYIEVFEDELGQQLNGEQTTFMHNMGASAQQLTYFVSNILNVARIEENALTLRVKEENWKDVLMIACRDMELRASVHNKKLIYDIAENLPSVAVDKVSIYEVLANLIDNAIKYTHTDEEIIIKSYEKDGMVETTVIDKGVGIAESLIGHIFDKFYRGHQTKNSTSGTGLGLYLSRAIIIAHGGSVWVQSTEGKGSTFGFRLPTYASVADQIKNEDNSGIVRGAHGWIKNHSLYRE